MLVNNLRGKQWQDALLEILLQIAVLLLGQITDVYMANALFQQTAAEMVKDPVPLAVEFPHLVKDGMKLLPGSHVALVVPLSRVHGLQTQEAAYPHHKELIQIAGKDFHELQPLAERHGVVLRLLQHSFVEFQPAQLPVLGIAGTGP